MPEQIHNTRHPDIFYLPHLSGNCMYNAPMYRTQKKVNKYRNALKFNGLMSKTFANKAKSL